MVFSLYIGISVIALAVSHCLSNLSVAYPKWNTFFFWSWLLFSLCVGMGHYGFAFNSEPEGWVFWIIEDDFEVTDNIMVAGLIFVLLNGLTAPPSIFNFLIKFIMNLWKKDKLDIK